MQVIDEAVPSWSAVADEDTFWETPAWSWWKVDLRSGRAVIDPALPVSAPYMTAYDVDGLRYVSRQMGDNQSRLYELAADGSHRPSFTSIGSIRGAFYAAIIVGLIDTMGRAFLPDLARHFLSYSAGSSAGPALSSMLIYTLMALVLIFRPEGLFPASSK